MKLLGVASVLILCRIASSTTTKEIPYFDNFDHPPNPLVLPVAAQVGNTAGGALSYNAFGYADLTLSKATLAPQSPPFSIGSGVTSQATQGPPGWKNMNSTVKYFSEKSIYYACQAYDAVGRVGVPVRCTLRLTGKKYDTGATVTQDFVYSPTGLTGQRFSLGIFSSSFTKLANVTVAIVPKVQQAVTVIDFDSHSYVAGISS